jgi:hypothetical protein
MKSWISLLAVLSSIALSGCFVGVAHDDSDAIFTVEWRIEGSSRRNACLDFGAEYAYVTVESRFGTEDYQTLPCEDFGYDFYVPPGRYSVTVTLLDSSHRDITTVLETASYSLGEGDGEVVVADFLEDSFF